MNYPTYSNAACRLCKAIVPPHERWTKHRPPHSTGLHLYPAVFSCPVHHLAFQVAQGLAAAHLGKPTRTNRKGNSL